MGEKARAKRLIRNRGSWSSSSESTTAGGGVGQHDEESITKVVRQREVSRYVRTFSLQEEQMPLTVTREDTDVSLQLHIF